MEELTIKNVIKTRIPDLNDVLELGYTGGNLYTYLTSLSTMHMGFMEQIIVDTVLLNTDTYQCKEGITKKAVLFCVAGDTIRKCNEVFKDIIKDGMKEFYIDEIDSSITLLRGETIAQDTELIIIHHMNTPKQNIKDQDMNTVLQYLVDENIEPMIVCIDGVNHMNSSNSICTERYKMGNVCEYLYRLSLQYNVPIVTSVFDVFRPGEATSILYLSQYNAYDIIRIASPVLQDIIENSSAVVILDTCTNNPKLTPDAKICVVRLKHRAVYGNETAGFYCGVDDQYGIKSIDTPMRFGTIK